MKDDNKYLENMMPNYEWYVVPMDKCSKVTELSDHFMDVIENRFA